METNCPICYQEYNLSTRLPRVTLVCGHSLCSLCLSSIIQDPNTSRCPLDKSPFPSGNNIEKFPVNFALKEVLETRPHTDSCPEHGDELISFCLTDKCKICAVCLEEEHRGHQTRAFKSIKGQAEKYRKQIVDLRQSVKEASKKADEMVEKERNFLMGKIEADYTALMEALAYKKQYLKAQTNILLNKEKSRIKSFLGDKSALCEEISRKDSSLQNILKNEELLQFEDTPNIIQNFSNQYQGIIASEVQKEKMEEELMQIEQSISYGVHPNLVLNKESEKLLLTLLKLETHFSFEFENDFLTIRNGNGNSSEVELDMPKVAKVHKVAFIFEQSVSPNDLELLTFIWGNLTELVGLKFQFTNDTLVEQLYHIFCTSHHFSQLQGITIDISENTLSEPWLMTSFIRHIFLMSTNLQIVELFMNNIEAAEGFIQKIFEGKIFRIGDLKELRLSMENAKVRDQDIKQIFVQMPKLQKLELTLNGPDITDETLVCLAQNTLASSELLQALYLDFYQTKVTDSGIEHLCKNLNSNKIRELQIEFAATQVTDKSTEMLGQRLLDLNLFSTLDIYWVGFSDTQISDNGLVKLFQPIPNVKDFRFAFSGTNITNKGIYHIIKMSLASIQIPQTYLIYLDDTKVTDDCFNKLLTSLKDAKEFQMGFNKTAISDRSLEPFIDQKLSAESFCRVLKITAEGSNISSRFQEKIKQIDNLMEQKEARCDST